MKVYNWQQDDWPNFRYRLDVVEPLLYQFAEMTGQSEGISRNLPDDVQVEQLLDILLMEAIKSSEIEGVHLSRQDVLSSIKKNLGLANNDVPVRDQKASGISTMLTNARKTFQQPLSEQVLFEWHTLLMANAKDVAIGQWRSHPESMQVVSGAAGKEKVHFEAPASNKVPEEVHAFIEWFNRTAPNGKSPIHSGPVRSAIAHLYFESIHPFEDGNGRIGRVIAEKALSQNLHRPILFSLSSVIEAERNAYYHALETAQRSNEITAWLIYFVNTILKAQERAYTSIEFTLKKSKFFDRFRDLLNVRQFKVIQKMLGTGVNEFEGGINARKYISITSASKATATRDLQDMVKKGVLVPKGAGGRSTSYDLNL
ncbi:MAG TPA: Fic family protein [Saprospiraceae bacterium]|nr:Fic family protein [Saprospiraceae bacterium]